MVCIGIKADRKDNGIEQKIHIQQTHRITFISYLKNVPKVYIGEKIALKKYSARKNWISICRRIQQDLLSHLTQKSIESGSKT